MPLDSHQGSEGVKDFPHRQSLVPSSLGKDIPPPTWVAGLRMVVTTGDPTAKSQEVESNQGSLSRKGGPQLDQVLTPTHLSYSRQVPKTPLVPKTAQDWNSVKHVIEELYLKNNVRLKDVVEIMRTQYNFQASLRMFKAQFEKWNWHKYETNNGRRKGLPTSLNHNSVQKSPLSRQILDTSDSREISTTLNVHSSLISNWMERDTRWNPNKPYVRMSAYNRTCCSHFQAAVYLFERKEYHQGGRLLRAAFLGLEDIIADGHISGMWDICVTMPKMALNANQNHLVLVFFRYIMALTANKEPNNPLTRAMRSLIALADASLRGSINHHGNLAWMLYRERFLRVLGKSNLHHLFITRAYLSVYDDADLTLKRKLLDGYRELVAEAKAKCGSQQTISIDLEYQALNCELRYGQPGPDYGGEIEELLLRLVAKKENKGIPPEMWSREDREIYRDCWRFYAEYYMSSDDHDRFHKGIDMFISAPRDGFWLGSMLGFERTLEAAGKMTEAAQVAKARNKYLSPSEVPSLIDIGKNEARLLADQTG